MIWISLVVFFGILAIIAAFILPRLSVEEGGPKVGVWGVIVPLGLYAVFFFLFTLFASLAQVPAGHRGLVYEFGNITDVRDPGLTFKPPWAGIKNADVRVQKYQIEDQCPNGQERCISAASVDSQNVFITATLNFSIANCTSIDQRRCDVDENAIKELYRDVGPDYVKKVIEQRFREVPKQRTIEFKAEEMLPNRTELASNIEDSFTESLEVDPRFAAIQVISYHIENIDFDSGFNDRIRQKVEAAQQIEVERNNVLVEAQKAEQQKAIAAGEAAARIERARGEAEANRLLSESLTQNLLNLKAIEAIKEGAIKIALLPADGNFLLDPSNLLNETTPGP